MPGTPSRRSTAHLGRVAARPLEEQLQALAAAEAADRSDVASHGGRSSVVSGQSVDVSVDRLAVVVRTRRRWRRGPLTTAAQTRRFLGGRQPLCGSGVTSSIALIERPEACRAVMARSRPEPGPLTLTSTSLTPNFVAVAGGGLGGPLGGERGALAAPLEADRPGRGPAQRVAVGVGDRDGRVVERRLDVHDRPADVASCLPLLGLGHGSGAPWSSSRGTRSCVQVVHADGMATYESSARRPGRAGRARAGYGQSRAGPASLALSAFP